MTKIRSGFTQLIALGWNLNKKKKGVTASCFGCLLLFLCNVRCLPSSDLWLSKTSHFQLNDYRSHDRCVCRLFEAALMIPSCFIGADKAGTSWIRQQWNVKHETEGNEVVPASIKRHFTTLNILCMIVWRRLCVVWSIWILLATILYRSIEP